ncbi:unnamed protein product [Protopolystoma xenopodis]|uniref:Uncharacterized protein n=1 Tax=Protopolystoma xenopodis TaxID=117903 RepID=A0A448XQ43_9PLAT|nr:unnamed protein product [Protopolystoma xenopodis]
MTVLTYRFLRLPPSWRSRLDFFSKSVEAQSPPMTFCLNQHVWDYICFPPAFDRGISSNWLHYEVQYRFPSSLPSLLLGPRSVQYIRSICGL